MEIRRTIGFNEFTMQALDEAAQVWPEHRENFSELVRQVIADWSRNRIENGGGRMARIVALEARANDHDRRILALEADRDANDYDHARDTTDAHDDQNKPTITYPHRYH